ncbi:MAG TPA: indolepyruvate ferredoxin oxidoreductase subunit alpha [Candidatus Latescibacteria bacterium]|nr:indolepyruvate ferredoxin oxidoreductase subunit alpha [Candidatus Latescibacterota bacterium]
MIEFLSGNEAIARGAFEAGVRVATAYPGTPSTEILENIAKYDGIQAQWSPNEKVALEVAIGASLAGARALVAMKHVGLNVAADPLMTISYVGPKGGLVVISADDPGMHSSQNEQDNRYYAKFAGVPMLEPSDSQEAKDFVRSAFEISSEFATPVLVRMTTRVCHSKGVVRLGETCNSPSMGYEKDVRKNVMVPAHARLRHLALEERRKRLEEYAERSPLNRTQMGDLSLGIITSGVAYQYSKEVFPDASFLKLGLTNPIPKGIIQRFAEKVARILVIEELEPFLEEQIRALGIEVVGKERIPRVGELSPDTIRSAILSSVAYSENPSSSLPARPPVLCPGCPHRGVFYVLRKLKFTVTGDIGCYTLAALPPLNAMDTCICMGASIGAALGMEKALGPEISGKTVAVIGDSTFIHSGITGLIDAVYNRSNITIIILDNNTTAMTGHQDHPGTGRTLKGEPTVSLDLEALARAVGLRSVRIVDPYDLDATEKAIREEVLKDRPSVIIARHPCVLLTKERYPTPKVDTEVCTGCKLCLRLGCPAISISEGKAEVDPFLCNGCGICAQVCRVHAMISGRT